MPDRGGQHHVTLTSGHRTQPTNIAGLYTVGCSLQHGTSPYFWVLYIALTMSGIEAVSVLKLTSNWCTRVSSVSGVFGQELV